MSADAGEVRRRYLQQAGDVEKMTEDHLVEQVQSLCDIVNGDEIQVKGTVDRARRLLAAFSAQMSSDEVPNTENPDELMAILLAEPSSLNDGDSDEVNLDREAILSTIRRNAFGPDYHSWNAITECWSEKATGENCYNRLLSAYPLAAMLNHSCVPNAVRVFGRIPSCDKSGAATNDSIQGQEVMIVHACARINKGREITWSYLPPSTPFAVRQEKLSSQYGFKCQCTRCVKEEEVANMPGLKEVWAIADNLWSLRDEKEDSAVANAIHAMEKLFALRQPNTISNETQRYLRVGYSSLYTDFFNSSMSLALKNDDDISSLLQLATQLHFSFVSCNNASTEHLSILHMCYELTGLLHTHAMKGIGSLDATKTITQVRFWTDQLKIAHMVRYGELGQEGETVREAMKHSKMVLRNRDGFYLVTHKFI